MTNNSSAVRISVSHLNSTDVARLRRKLELQREALVASELEERDVMRGVTDYAIEPGDVAQRMVDQQSALRQDVITRAAVAEIDRALRKIAAGTYGFSEESGEPIELERLEALPWARRTAHEEQRRRLVRWQFSRAAK
jgi:DnaK suppressor protein